jgi:hypothetical protein
MKTMMPAGRPKRGPARPLSCHGSGLDFDRGTGAGPDFRALLNRWRIEHLEQDWSFRARVLRAAGLVE